jgi:ribokinase
VTGRVIVVGSVNEDLVLRVPRLPAPGETVVGGTFERHHGGKGGNQAVAAARLGVPTMLVGAVGGDSFGREALAALAADTVDVAHVEILSDEPTGVAVIVVNPNGENQIAVASGANGQLSQAAVVDAMTRLRPVPGDIVLVSSEIPPGSVAAALRAGRRAGALTILNPAPADGIDRATFALADVLTPNWGELARLVATETDRSGRRGRGLDDPERAARSLLNAGPDGLGVRSAIILTLGPSGALLVPADGSLSLDLPATSVRAVDATGAGDTFNGALAAGLAEGRLLADAARRAVVAAGLATTVAGAREGMPTAAALRAAGVA